MSLETIKQNLITFANGLDSGGVTDALCANKGGSCAALDRKQEEDNHEEKFCIYQS